MEIPRFETQKVNPRLAPTDIGDAFQAFVQDLLLPEHPKLHRFPGGGKDGGIDLIETSETCFVVECKVVGADDYGEVERRWKEVRKKLEKHLINPSGPTIGQSQYHPWYATDTPITEYVFSVSASMANEQQLRNLKTVIEEFFVELARRHSHLSHLSQLKVSILDWNGLSARLRQRPHLLFRWFPSMRPNGLVPLDESIDVGTFRAYLTDAKLPYYSIAEHLQHAPPPKGISILDEKNLLARFENPDITGLVISGKGGIGKSRLTLELGWLALRNGWSVMRVQQRLREGALEDLAERLTPNTTALLLVDYIETQNDFGELVENLNVLNDSGVARLRYIAACRTGYYHQAIAASGRHLAVDLTPPPGDVSLDWFSDYRRNTVRNILAKAGLPVSQQHLTVCRDLPILAVLLAYLHTSGRNEDLAELLSEVEFGRWVAKRVHLSFPTRDVSRELALLVPLFPMADFAASRLSQNLYRPVFDRLATDGWIEEVPASGTQLFETWLTAHDVLADQILLSYLRSIPNTVEKLVSELFSLAAETGCLTSAIVSLQRNADTPPLSALPWSKVIIESIAASQLAWRDVRDVLIRTTLLSEQDKIALLNSLDGLWVGAEQDASFQKSLGWLAKWVATHPDESSEQNKAIVISWLSRTVPFADSSNFVLTWGLRLAPEIVQESAYRWISHRTPLFQTHYLMVAWLERGLPTASIATYVEQWGQKFSRRFHLSFLVVAWLVAGGDKTMVEEAIKDWQVEHRTLPEASHVYQAWLGAGGDKALVEEGIKDWLIEHRTRPEARFVYAEWLKTGGDKPIVQEGIKDWLVKHRTLREADFVYNAWLNAGGDKALVQREIKDWLCEHRTLPEARFVYDEWLEAGGDKTLVEKGIRDWLVEHRALPEASHVYQKWLDAGGDKALVQEGIRDWLVEHRTLPEANFVYQAWLNVGGDKALVQEGIGDWLMRHRTLPEASHVYQAWLDAGGDKALVQEGIRDWLVEHRTLQEASHVYNAWLNAGGNKALVQEGIRTWLAEHREHADVDHVFRSWLEAGGERELVWDSALAWLARHSLEESAVYVTKFIAKQRDLSVNTVRDVLIWCRTFPDHEDALWRLTQLGTNLFAAGVEDDLVLTSEIVLANLLSPTSLPERVTRGQITTLFSYLLELSQMQLKIRERVDVMFVRWLQHPLSFGTDPIPHRNTQRLSFLERLSALIYSGTLELDRDSQLLKRFMLWMAAWDTRSKERAYALLDELKSKYPSPGLWEIGPVQ